MSDTVIHCEGVGKLYRIGQRDSYGMLRETISNAVSAPLRRLRSAAKRSAESNGKEVQGSFWALKDLSFKVKTGEVLGIIGRNGAGKSTLLKILSRITKPTEGYIDIHGRVGALLEVGTGFHPELSGRENIFLNGAMLGMKRAEIRRKFDEIVAFAEVEEFIDTPVKRYSSGMYVRLAFGVAAHLEPEILIVDEVLAVGDAQFQKKCLGKIGSVASEGRTVLFVSHNMTVVNQLCSRAILLKDGRIAREGTARDVVPAYLQMGSDSGGEQVWTDRSLAPGNGKIRLQAIRILSKRAVCSDVDIDQEVTIEVDFWNLKLNSRNLCVNIYLLDSFGNTILSTANIPSANSITEDWFERPHPVGLFRSTCTLPGNFLNEGLYYISVYVVTLGPVVLEAEAQQVLSFRVFDTGEMRPAGGGKWLGVVRMRLPWRTELLEAAS